MLTFYLSPQQLLVSCIVSLAGLAFKQARDEAIDDLIVSFYCVGQDGHVKLNSFGCKNFKTSALFL